MSLDEVAAELSKRLESIFLPDAGGVRPVFRDDPLGADPLWRDNVLFYEYFNGDTGAGVGASHQTGWTGLVAKLLERTTGGAERPTSIVGDHPRPSAARGGSANG